MHMEQARVWEAWRHAIYSARGVIWEAGGKTAPPGVFQTRAWVVFEFWHFRNFREKIFQIRDIGGLKETATISPILGGI